MIVTPKDILGLGIYTPSEAALYARLSPQTMKRWVHGDERAGAVLEPQLEDDLGKRVTFLDLVQALAIREVRREKKIPLAKIREAISIAKDKYHVEYPFAMRHKTFLWGSDIIIELPQGGDLVQISGKNKRQLMLREIAELYMGMITFGQDGLANLFKAFEHEGLKVVIDPTRKLGKPYLPDCDYPAEVLVNAYQTEGSVDAAAQAFGVSAKDVDLAIRYFDYLRGPMAA
jgi:uncharacterized protein (DUF433 family)